MSDLTRRLSETVIGLDEGADSTLGVGYLSTSSAPTNEYREAAASIRMMAKPLMRVLLTKTFHTLWMTPDMSGGSWQDYN